MMYIQDLFYSYTSLYDMSKTSSEQLRALVTRLLEHLTENPESEMKKVAKEFGLVAPRPLNSIVSALEKAGFCVYKTRNGKAKKYWSLDGGVEFSREGNRVVLSFEVADEE